MGVKSNSPQEIYFGSFDSTEGSGIGLDPIPPVPFTATGGTTSEPGNGYKYHLFTASGSFVGTGDPVTGAEVLVVAGGGGGGSYYGGGGGGGGVVNATSVTFASGTYPVVIGTGGPGGSPGTQAPSGVNSTFGNPTPGPAYYLLAEGGGGGGGTYYGPNGSGLPGGCGGGSGGGDPSPANGQATQPGTNPSPRPVYGSVVDYGQPGGFSVPTGGYGTAGGGGAGGAGGNCPGNVSGGGDGGTGYSFPAFTYPLVGLTPIQPIANSPTNSHYAGGGGGRLYGGVGPAGSGAAGAGGGGQGFPSGAPPLINAVDGLGGGGGGTHPGGGGAGGDGVVIVRYPVS